MTILGPLPWSTTSAVTLVLASAAASDVTASPSTRSSAGSVTVSPGPAERRSTVSVSPTATLCWWPPARTIAYTDVLLDCCRGIRSRLRIVARTGQTFGLGREAAGLSGHLVRTGHFAPRGE